MFIWLPCVLRYKLPLARLTYFFRSSGSTMPYDTYLDSTIPDASIVGIPALQKVVCLDSW